MGNEFKKVFSVKNEIYHKVIQIFGLKIKILNENLLKQAIKNFDNNIVKENEQKEILKSLEPEFRNYVIDNDLYNMLLKLKPRNAENFIAEINLTDHCNLNCQCCDHFSPLADEFYLDLETFEKDVKQFAKLTCENVMGGGWIVINRRGAAFTSGYL